jgi:hypothetical protein
MNRTIPHQQFVRVLLAGQRRPQVKAVGLGGFAQQVQPRPVRVAPQQERRRSRLVAQDAANREAQPISETTLR